MSVYLDIKSLYPHLNVNWNVLMCKICIARRLVVDIFPWCNANFVPFPIGTLVECQMPNGSIELNISCRFHSFCFNCLDQLYNLKLAVTISLPRHPNSSLQFIWIWKGQPCLEAIQVCTFCISFEYSGNNVGWGCYSTLVW